MKRPLYAIPVLLLVLFAMGCAKQATLGTTYPKMYQEPPVSILILPPLNNSTAADAKEYFSCSLAEAVGRMGYYIMPVESMFNILRDEGLYETEHITPAVLANMRKHFGADAVLYTSIEEWHKSWFLVSGSLTITAKFALISTAAADTLWDFTTQTKVKLGSSSDNLLVAAVESAVKTALEDYFPNALQSNINTMDKALPSGKYHPKFGVDGEKAIPADKKGTYSISK